MGRYFLSYRPEAKTGPALFSAGFFNYIKYKFYI